MADAGNKAEKKLKPNNMLLKSTFSHRKVTIIQQKKTSRAKFYFPATLLKNNSN
jgi:hypothetical protein